MFLANNGSCCDSGDIVGFVTRRPNLDYFHIGFVAFGDDGDLLLRHASREPRAACSTSAWTAFVARIPRALRHAAAAAGSAAVA